MILCLFKGRMLIATALWSGIVEMMAAGLLTIAHRSGGPLMDIVTEDAGARNGFLAVTAQEYAAHIAFIINMTEEVRGHYHK